MLAMAFYVDYDVVYTISCYLSGTLAPSIGGTERRGLRKPATPGR